MKYVKKVEHSLYFSSSFGVSDSTRAFNFSFFLIFLVWMHYEKKTSNCKSLCFSNTYFDCDFEIPSTIRKIK